MKVRTLESEQTIARPLQEVFTFFNQPENLGHITPANLGFQLLTPTPVVMREGAIIDYVVTLAGIPLRWRSLITAHEPPHRFVDEQLLGPYAFWHHTHTFTPVANGTRVGDRVLYALPLGPLGDLAHALMVGRQLRGIFEHRRRVIEQIFVTPAEQDTELLS